MFNECQLNIFQDLEGMFPFRGRIHFRVYMKNKPIKYEIKFYIFTDAQTGYVLNAEIQAYADSANG